MKFRFIIKNSLKIALIVFGLVIAGCVGFTIYNLSVNGADAFSIVSLVLAFIVLLAICLLLINTGYTFTESYLKVSLGIMNQKIYYNDVLQIKNYVNQKEMFIIFRPRNAKTKDALSQIMVNVKPELFADFVDALKSKNSEILYDEVNGHVSEEE